MMHRTPETPRLSTYERVTFAIGMGMLGLSFIDGVALHTLPQIADCLLVVASGLPLFMCAVSIAFNPRS